MTFCSQFSLFTIAWRFLRSWWRRLYLSIDGLLPKSIRSERIQLKRCVNMLYIQYGPICKSEVTSVIDSSPRIVARAFLSTYQNQSQNPSFFTGSSHRNHHLCPFKFEMLLVSFQFRSHLIWFEVVRLFKIHSRWSTDITNRVHSTMYLVVSENLTKVYESLRVWTRFKSTIKSKSCLFMGIRGSRPA